MSGGSVWRPSPALLKREGDRYEIDTPFGTHAGKVVVGPGDETSPGPTAAWGPIPVAIGFGHGGVPIVELNSGSLQFSVDVQVEGAGEQWGVLSIDMDLAEKRADLALKVGVDVHRVVSADMLEGALLDLKSKLGSRHLRRCFYCLYSDYSYAGQDFSGMLCFRDARERYLQVRSKRDFMKMVDEAVTEVVDELYVCDEFAPRVPETGYRG